MNEEIDSCKSCKDVFLIAQQYQVIQSLSVLHPNMKTTIDNLITTLRNAIDKHGSFTAQEIKCLLAHILESGTLLTEIVDSYGKQNDGYTLTEAEEKQHAKLKAEDKLKAIDYYMQVLEKNNDGQKLQKRKRKSGGIRKEDTKKRTLKAQQKERWTNWPNDLSLKAEQTKFINQMVDEGLATDPRTVRANIKDWKREGSN